MKKKLRKELNKLIPEGFEAKKIASTDLITSLGRFHIFVDIKEKTPKFKVDDWCSIAFKGEPDENPDYVLITEIKEGSVIGNGFISKNQWVDNEVFAELDDSELIIKPADMSKVKQLLVEKAKKDYPVGTRVKSTYGTEGVVESINILEEGFDKIYVDDGGYLVYENGKWAEIIKPKYIIDIEVNWKLKEADRYNYSGYEPIFDDKQSALDFILKEAKERFEGKDFTHRENCNIKKAVNIHTAFEQNTGIYSDTWCLWTEKKGWIAEPIKDKPLMLGSERVEFEWHYSNLGHEGTKPVQTGITIHCKGESVTKEEWMSFYSDFDVFLHSKINCTHIVFKLGKWIIEYTKLLNQLMIEPSCSDGLSGITIDQIEEITKKLI